MTTIEQRIKLDPEALGQTSEEFSETALIAGGINSFSDFVGGIVGGTGLFIVFFLIIIGSAAGMKWLGAKLKETKAVGIMKAISTNPIGFFFLIYFIVVSFSLILGIILFLALFISVISVKGNPRSVGMIGFWGGGRGGFGGSGGGGGFGGFGGGFSGGGGAGGGW